MFEPLLSLCLMRFFVKNWHRYVKRVCPSHTMCHVTELPPHFAHVWSVGMLLPPTTSKFKCFYEFNWIHDYVCREKYSNRIVGQNKGGLSTGFRKFGSSRRMPKVFDIFILTGKCQYGKKLEIFSFIFCLSNSV